MWAEVGDALIVRVAVCAVKRVVLGECLGEHHGSHRHDGEAGEDFTDVSNSIEACRVRVAVVADGRLSHAAPSSLIILSESRARSRRARNSSGVMMMALAGASASPCGCAGLGSAIKVQNSLKERRRSPVFMRLTPLSSRESASRIAATGIAHKWLSSKLTVLQTGLMVMTGHLCQTRRQGIA
nr:MAG TPA: hypothetical protein [Caudoviricetes sp.]DAY08164.1 MAG TPA: hypothetical protein [Herelleviridae sp.]